MPKSNRNNDCENWLSVGRGQEGDGVEKNTNNNGGGKSLNKKRRGC